MIYTDTLNNASYNHALGKYNLKLISDIKRITRDITFKKHPEINNTIKHRILKLKQSYFIENLNITIPNKDLLKLLVRQPRENCILWTSANELRVNEILKYYKIEKEFKVILFSPKLDVNLDLEKIYCFFGCELQQIIFFEDDQEVIKRLQKMEAEVVII